MTTNNNGLILANGTVTFTEKTGRFTMTAKDEFLKTCPSPADFDYMTLLSEYYVMNYFHNPKGPAIVRFLKSAADGQVERQEHWLDGVCLNSEDPERLKSLLAEIEFNDKFEAKLSSSEENTA